MNCNFRYLGITKALPKNPNSTPGSWFGDDAKGWIAEGLLKGCSSLVIFNISGQVYPF
jgi:hypothetical protein